MYLGQPVSIATSTTPLPSVEALFPYLSEHWARVHRTSAFKAPSDTAYPPRAATRRAPGVSAPDGKPPGSSLELIQQDLLDPLGRRDRHLIARNAVDSPPQPGYAAAMRLGSDDWLIAEWLAKEPRLRASMVVPTRGAGDGAKEIDRIGDHPGFVRCCCRPIRSALRQWRYCPFSRSPRGATWSSASVWWLAGNPPTGRAGRRTTRGVRGDGQIFQTQVLNMIVEGIFDRVRHLRVR